MVRGASKRVSFHLHTPHVFFNGTSSSGDLCLLLLLGLCGCGAELLVRQMGWACNGIGVIGGRLRGRLLGLGARIMVEVLFIDESGVQVCLSPTSRVPSARGRWPRDSRYFPSAGPGLLNAYVSTYGSDPPCCHPYVDVVLPESRAELWPTPYTHS